MLVFLSSIVVFVALVQFGFKNLSIFVLRISDVFPSASRGTSLLLSRRVAADQVSSIVLIFLREFPRTFVFPDLIVADQVGNILPKFSRKVTGVFFLPMDVPKFSTFSELYYCFRTGLLPTRSAAVC